MLFKNYKKHRYKDEDKVRLDVFLTECQKVVETAKLAYLNLLTSFIACRKKIVIEITKINMRSNSLSASFLMTDAFSQVEIGARVKYSII